MSAVTLIVLFAGYSSILQLFHVALDCSFNFIKLTTDTNFRQKDHTTGKLRSFLTKEGSSSNICATKTISELSASSRKAVTSNTIKFALALQQYALLECPISPNALLELCEKLLQADDWKSDSCVNIVMSACTHANLQPSQLYETLKAKGIRVHSLKERQDMFAMLTALSEPAAIDSVDIHDACRDDTS